MLDLSVIDFVALAWFILGWLAYAVISDNTRLRAKSVSAAMGEQRERWMTMMLRREHRIVDSNILGNLLHGVAFFASTTILLVGGLLAMLGASDMAVQVLGDLPFIVPTSETAWRVKILLLATIFVYAFFKFAWAMRLFNYCAVLIGAAPVETGPSPEAKKFAHGAARMNTLAAGHFNQGLRAYFFALAALGWFLHPAVFMLATAWVIYVLQRREFRSRALRVMRGVR